MNNIYDYVEYYKNMSWEEIPFNQMDALIFSVFAYLPLHGKEELSLKEVWNEVENMSFSKKMMRYLAKTILKRIQGSIRYQDIRFSNAVKREDHVMQFGALAIRFENALFISYEGTNRSIIGWKENFLLSSVYPTDTQKESLFYLIRTAKRKDKMIYLGGHSKGGNLAIFSAMESPFGIRKKIRGVYNFDGPGFLKKQVESIKYKKMSPKIHTIIPDGSMVGVILNHQSYQVVTSSGTGFEKHNPSKWHLFGEVFENGTLTDASKKLKESVERSISGADPKEMKILVDKLFDFFLEEGFQNISDLKKIKPKDIKKIFDETKNLSEESKQSFMKLLKTFFNIGSVKKENVS